jgi:outer membrane protein
MRKSLTWGLAAAISLATASSVADTLQETYLLALDNDHQLKADEAEYRAGLEAKVIGRSALLPQINATATYSDTEYDSLGYQGDPIFDTIASEVESENEAYSVTLTQPLFNMPAWFGYKQGVSLSQLSESQFSADQQSLIIRVSEGYLNVLSAVDNLETAMAEENALSHQLEQTRQRFEVGLTAITDVHEAQAAYDTAVATTLEARGNLGIAFEQLEVLTGKPTDTIAPLVDNFPVTNPEPMARHEWVDFAVKNNYNLKVAKLNSEASRQNARAKTSAHLPTLTGSYSYTDRDDTNTDVNFPGASTPFTPDSRVDDRKTVAIQLDVPIFSGLRTSGERRQAHQQHMQNQELYNQAQRDTIQAARSLHLSVVTDVAQVKARKQATISNQSALEATQAGYEVGTRNLVDVLVAQRSLYQAQRNYDTSRYEYILNMLRLKEVAGNLTPEDILKLNQWMDEATQVKREQFEK